MKSYVLDASALMTLFENRPGAGKVEAILKPTAEQNRLLLSVVNWGEVYYTVWVSKGEKAANEHVEHIAKLLIEVVDLDQPTTKLAASFKARYQLPYADSFSAAVAQQHQAILVTADRDFTRVEKWVSILWV